MEDFATSIGAFAETVALFYDTLEVRKIVSTGVLLFRRINSYPKA